MTGYELARAVLDAAAVEYKAPPPAEVTDLSPEYWAGWAHPESRLKTMREKRGMTQEELSSAAHVPLRMIQHYEQRVKNLGKAAFDTVFRLAQTLHVRAQDILEPTFL